MFESSLECMDMCSARKQDMLRTADKFSRVRKAKEAKSRAGRQPGRLLTAALIIKNLIK